MIWHQRGQDHNAQRTTKISPPGPEAYPSFAGCYHQPELKAGYSILFDEGKLKLQTPENFKKYLGTDLFELDHVNGDKFYAGWLGMLEFTRDEDIRINGFILLNVGRLQNIKFLKKKLPKE